MTAARYEEPAPATAADVAAMITAGRSGLDVAQALVGAALHDPDWRAMESLCLELITRNDAQLAAAAVTCLGHLARIHGQLDLARVRPALAAVRDHPVIGPRVEDALDDIAVFAPSADDR